MKRSGTSLLLAILILAHSDGIEAREFTDSSGRKIEAELVGYSGNTVIINRGGKEFPVSATIFSLDDQEYIKGWIAENPDKARYSFGFYADLDRKSVSQSKAPGGMIDDKLKVIPYNYEMIVYNKGIAPAEDLEIRYEIYVEDFVDVRNNRFTRMAVGGEKSARTQVVPGKLPAMTIPANGRHDFERDFNTEFYIDRDGGKTDAAATDKVIGVRIRVYKNGKLLAEHEEGEDDDKLAKTTWQDATPYEGPGPEE